VGLFGLALALQGPGGIFLGGIVNIWAPVVSELYDKGAIDRLESLYQTITRWVATFSFPVFAALIIEPDMFLSIFPEDAAGAASIVAILAVGNFFYTGTGPSGYVLSMSGRPGVNFVNSLIGVLLYIGFGLFAVPRWGLVGMAVVDASVTAVINSVRVFQVKQLIGVQPFGRSFLKPVGATLIGAGALLLWKLVPGESFWLDVAGVGVAAVVYAVALKMMGLDAEERYVWERIRRRAFKRKGKGKSTA
jgi:O-antigen/teichoic acid export membrane protein